MHKGAARPVGLHLLLWLSVAILAHILVALFGVLNRFLQVKPAPPLPALRLALLVTLLALTGLAVVTAASAAAAWLVSKWQARQKPNANVLPVVSSLKLKGSDSSKSKCVHEGKTTCRQNPAAAAPAPIAAPRCCRISADSSMIGLSRTSGQVERTGSTALQIHGSPEEHHDAAPAARGPCQPMPAAQQQQVLPVASGLSRKVQDLCAARPRLVTYCALALITTSTSAAFICQMTAPGFVDPALVQLVNMFGVIGVALVQRLLLRHHLPLLIWPCSAIMLAGACMVIVPSLDKGASGGLHGWRGWLGFGLSVCSMVSTVIYFVSLQASRNLGFTSPLLQCCTFVFSVLVLLVLSLPIDGADWGCQFVGWTVSNWAVLVLTGAVVCVGLNYLLMNATWVLGAPTIAMFYGLRLVASIVETKVLLSTTVVNSALQIAGTVITVAAVTVYMVSQFLQSKRQAAELELDQGSETSGVTCASQPAAAMDGSQRQASSSNGTAAS